MLSHDNQLLISAYNDGEVSPDEQTRAEQLLVDDAAARAFREELLAMSSQLQSLPQHKLPADFSADVLAAAEKAMFTSQPWPGDTEVAAPSPLTRVFNIRTIAYAGATIAAAILVTLFIPHDGRDVADNAAKEPAVADTPAVKTSDPVELELTVPQKSPAAGESREKDIADKGTSGKEDAESLKPNENRVTEESKSLVESEPIAKPSIKNRPDRDDKLADRAGDDAKSAEAVDAFAANAHIAASPKPTGSLGLSRKNTEPPLMVVSLDVGEAALRDGTLQRVLAAHRVRSKDRGARYSLGGQGGRKFMKKAAKEQDLRTLSIARSTQTVYAEMSRSQLNQVLSQLKTDPKGFSSVALFGGKTALQQAGGRATASVNRYATEGKKDADGSTELDKKRELEQATRHATAEPKSDVDKPTRPGAAADPTKADPKQDEPSERGKTLPVDQIASAGKAGHRDSKKKETAGELAGDPFSRRSTWKATGNDGAERVRVLFVLRPAQSTESAAAKGD